MKLFTCYNRINLPATVFIFLLSILSFYFFLRYLLISQVDEDLQIEKTEIVAYATRYQHLPPMMQFEDQYIIYTPSVQVLPGNIFKSISGKTGEEDIRQLLFSIQLPGGWYTVTVSKSLEGTDYLTHTLALMTLVMILLILSASYIVNRMVLRRLWRPFFDTLKAMQQFRLGKNERLQLPETNIDEFTAMNATLQQAIQKAEKDYLLLKEFTENASHELQTPLAVIRSKLELLMQYPLAEEESKIVESAGHAVTSMARLNKSLLLLAKIQNNQFADKMVLDLKEMVAEKLEIYQEIAEAKHIQMAASLHNLLVMINPDLAGLLLSNLIGNAIKHNRPGGKINIEITERKLTITNTGAVTAIDESKIFSRFYNPGKAEHSTGLGLSIVKQICDVSAFTIQYRFQNGLHQFVVHF